MIILNVYEEKKIIYAKKIVDGKVVGQRTSVYSESIKPKDIKNEYKEIRDIEKNDGYPCHSMVW